MMAENFSSILVWFYVQVHSCVKELQDCIRFLSNAYSKCCLNCS